MANDRGASPSVVVDDSGRLRVLDPETNFHSRLVAQSCTAFQLKLQHFQNVKSSKRLSVCLLFRMYIPSVSFILTPEM